jgi:hypothetical protein
VSADVEPLGVASQAIELALDVDRFTLAELVDLEDATGQPFSELGEQLGSGKVSAKALVAMVWVLRRRVDPTFTLDDARAIELNNIAFKNTAKRKPQDHLAPGGKRRPPA